MTDAIVKIWRKKLGKTNDFQNNSGGYNFGEVVVPALVILPKDWYLLTAWIFFFPRKASISLLLMTIDTGVIDLQCIDILEFQNNES